METVFEDKSKLPTAVSRAFPASVGALTSLLESCDALFGWPSTADEAGPKRKGKLQACRFVTARQVTSFLDVCRDAERNSRGGALVWLCLTWG